MIQLQKCQQSDLLLQHQLELFLWLHPVLCYEDGDTLRIGIEYNTDLFDADRIKRMGEHYQILLHNAIAEPERSIATLAMLSETERHKILQSRVQPHVTDKSVPEDGLVVRHDPKSPLDQSPMSSNASVAIRLEVPPGCLELADQCQTCSLSALAVVVACQRCLAYAVYSARDASPALLELLA